MYIRSWYLYVCICWCICKNVNVNTPKYVFVCRPELRCFPESFPTCMFLETESLSESGADQFSLDWPVNSRDLAFSAFSVLELQMHNIMASFYMGAGNPKPGPQYFREITFPTDPSSKHLGNLK